MKSRVSRTLSIMLSLCMIASTPLSVSATGVDLSTNAGNPSGNVVNDISVTGSNSFGKLFSEEYYENYSQEEAMGYGVYSVEFVDNVATVTFGTLQTSTLVVGIFDETDNSKMITSKEIQIYKEDTTAKLTFDSNSMPEYFYVKAYLVDSETLRPLSKEYTSPKYTADMQYLEQLSTTDFPDEQVLNLDNDTENNFAIYNTDVKVIDESDSVNAETNIVKSVDDTNGVYVFENIDTAISSLNVGDTFSYAYDEDGLIIAKIAEITIDGTTATIKSEDIEMDQIFDYVKIEVEPSINEVTIDNQDLPEGVTYNGVITEDSPSVVNEGENTVISEDTVSKEIKYETTVTSSTNTVNTEEAISKAVSKDVVESGASGSVSGSFGASYNIKEFKPSNNNLLSKITISGSVELEIKPGVEFDLTKNNKYFEVKIDYSLGLKLSPSFGDKKDDDNKEDDNKEDDNKEDDNKEDDNKEEAALFMIKFGDFIFVPVPGVTVSAKPQAVIEINAEIQLSLTTSGTIGFSVSNGATQNLTTAPKVKTELKIEGKIFVGLQIEGEVSLFAKLANAKLTGTAGVEATAAIEKPIEESVSRLFDAPPSIHDCLACIEGKLVGKFNLNFTAELLKSDKLTFNIDLLNVEFHITDFYWSITKGTADWTKCPYRKYKITVNTVDTSSAPIENAKITVHDHNDQIVKTHFIGDHETTNKKGKVTFYVFPGDYNLKVTVPHEEYEEVTTYARKEKRLVVTDQAKSVYIELLTLDEALDKNRNITPKKLDFGGSHSSCLTENGDLYMWGNNYYGSVGTSKSGITSIMGEVSYASLGWYHSGCVTKTGNLYTWGFNRYYQLGNGTTYNQYEPIHIDIGDNVKIKELCLGHEISALVTENNELYTWGTGHSGLSGFKKPEKVLNIGNVKTVSLGLRHAAIITENGDLYMWGDNTYGQLGIGFNKQNYYISPQPVMLGVKVKEVSLGEFHSACITEDNKLYVWGCNQSSQLGNVIPTNDDEDKLRCIYKPQQLMSEIKFKQVSLGSFHSGALTEAGDLYMWGENLWGQIGAGTNESKIKPTKITTIPEEIKELELGHYHTGVITEDGNIYIWGSNRSGELGDGTNTNRNSPVKISLIPKATTSKSNSKQVSNASSASSISSDVSLSKTANTVTAVASGAGVASTKNFYGLMPNEEYNFYAMKSKNALNPLSSENLLYISQAVTDENGKLSVNYTMTEDYQNAELFVVPIEQIDLSEATVTMDNLEYMVDEQFIHPTVTLYGATLIEGKDYELCNHYYAQNIGEYSVTIRGIGKYTGEVEFTYCVNSKAGDVSLDGKLTVVDTIMVMKYIIGNLELDVQKQSLADMNKDGKITVLDVIMLQRAILDFTA